MADYSLFKNLRGIAQDAPGETEALDAYVDSFKDSSKDSPEVIAAAERLQRGDSSKDSYLQQVSNQAPKDEPVLLKAGFQPTLKEGFKPTLKPGFRATVSENPTLGYEEMWNQARNIENQALHAAAQPADKKDTTDHTLWGDLNDNMEGTGRQMGDMITYLPRMLGSWGLGIKDLLEGKDPKKAGEHMDKFMSDTSIQGDYPTNPAIDSVLKPMGDAISSAANIDAMDMLMPGLRTSSNDDTGLNPNPLLGNDVGVKIGEGLLSAVPTIKGGKAIRDNFIEGSSRRVGTDSGLLEGPARGSDPAKLIQDNKSYGEKINKEFVDQYNAGPERYGVDESGTRNPYNKEGTAEPPAETVLDDGTPLKATEVNMDAVAEKTDPRFNYPVTDGYTMELMRRDVPRNMDHALRTVQKYANDEYESRLAKIFGSVPNISKIPFYAMNGRGENGATTSHGTTRFNSDGVEYIQLNVNTKKQELSGFAPQVILHEAAHGGTWVPLTIGNFALDLHRQGHTKEAEVLEQKYPHEVQFARDINKIRYMMEAGLKEELGETGFAHWELKINRMLAGVENGTKFSNMYPKAENKSKNVGHEFISWVMTDPGVQNIMRALYPSPDIAEPKYSMRRTKIYHQYAGGTFNLPMERYNLKKKRDKLLAKNANKQTVWDHFVDSVANLFGVGSRSRDLEAAKLKAKMDELLEYKDTTQSGAELLEDIVFPYLKARGDATFDPHILGQAIDHFHEPLERTKKRAKANALPNFKRMQKDMKLLVEEYIGKPGDMVHVLMDWKRPEGPVEKALWKAKTGEDLNDYPDRERSKDIPFRIKSVVLQTPWEDFDGKDAQHYYRVRGEILTKDGWKPRVVNADEIREVNDLLRPSGRVTVDTLVRKATKDGNEGDYTASAEMAAYDGASPKAKEMLQKLVSPWRDYGQMYTDMGDKMYQYKDLNRVTGNFYPVSMVKNIANNPIVTFAFSKIRTIYGDAHHFEVMFVAALDDFKKAPDDVKKRLVVALNEINRPETQDQLKLARAQNPQAYGNDPSRVTDAELTHYGAHQSDIPLYRKTLEPLFRALLKMDQWSMVHGFGRPLTSDVIGYYPRSFGYGKFSIKGFNPSSGAMEFFRRAPTWKEVRIYEEALRHKGYHTQREVSKDFADYKQHILALQEIDPNSAISKIGQATLDAAEEHRRTQEFERNARGVAGFIGQNAHDPKEIKLLIQMAYHRIQQTTEAYKAARLLEEVMRPMQKDIRANYHYPVAVKWVTDVVRRELGAETSINPLDWMFQWTLNKAHIAFMQRGTKVMRILASDIRPEEQTINPIAHKELARYLAAGSSAWALAGNFPNLVVNAFSIPLVSLLGGIPDVMMLSGNPAEAVAKATKAHLEAMSDWALIAAQQSHKSWAPTDLNKFIRLAINRGLTIANAFNDIPEMRAEIEKTTARRVVDKTLNIPREYFNDYAETGTNMMALLFYRRLVQELWPKFTFQENFDLAVDLAKRYTGDYAKYNKALMFDKAGDPGQMASNFSIWTGTRVGQTHEMVKNVITKKQMAPLVALMLANIVTAGIAGMPFVGDYDKLTQWFAHLSEDKETYIPPLDLVLKNAEVPHWLRQGIILNSFGMDLSSRGKWSGYTDFGGVTYTAPGKAIDIYDYIHGTMTGSYPDTDKSYLGNRYKPSGTNVKTDADFVQAAPAAAQGYLRQKLMTRAQPDGTRTVLSSHGSAMYKQKKDDYWWNITNFRTVEQGDAQRNFYNSIYTKSKRDQETRSLKGTAIKEILQALSARRDGNKERSTELMRAARANLIKLAKANPQAFDNFSSDILNGYQKESDTVHEKELKQAAKSKNAVEVKRLIDEVRLFLRTKP